MYSYLPLCHRANHWVVTRKWNLREARGTSLVGSQGGRTVILRPRLPCPSAERPRPRPLTWLWPSRAPPPAPRHVPGKESTASYGRCPWSSSRHLLRTLPLTPTPHLEREGVVSRKSRSSHIMDSCSSFLFNHLQSQRMNKTY
jgi:hypothetical protein